MRATEDKCDSYFRLNAAGTGYAFVFNANDTPVSTELPLDERCGLAAGREYRVRPEFPDSPDTQVARRSLAVTVPARQVLLLSIRLAISQSDEYAVPR